MQFLTTVSIVALVAIEAVSGAAVAAVPKITVKGYKQDQCASLITKSRRVLQTDGACVTIPVKSFSVSATFNQAALDQGCQLGLFMSTNCEGNPGGYDESECISSQGFGTWKSAMLICEDA